MTRAAIDGDSMAFAAALRAVDKQDWGDGNGVVETASKAEAERALLEYKETIEDAIAADQDSVICLGGHGNWRKEIYPPYKANRKGKEPPELLFWCYGFMRDNFDVVSFPELEADDALGIVCTSEPDCVLVSPDKDLRTIPGRLFNPRKKTFETITPAQAFYNHMWQTLVGDGADNFPGCPRVGEKTAPKYIGEYPDKTLKGTKRWAIAMWKAVVNAFEEHRQTEAEALLMARVAHILTARYWNGSSRVEWSPPSTWG